MVLKVKEDIKITDNEIVNISPSHSKRFLLGDNESELSKVISNSDKRTRILGDLLNKYSDKLDKVVEGFNIFGSQFDKVEGSKMPILIGFDLIVIVKDNEIKNYIFLNEKQKLAFKSFQLFNTDIEEIVYGGGAGGGKTHLISVILLINSFLYQDSKWFVARRVLKDVRNSTIQAFIDLLNKCGFMPETDYSHNQQRAQITIKKSNSIISYGEIEDLPGDPNFSRVGSFEYTGIFIDEAQEVIGKAKSVLKFRLRATTKSKFNEDGKEEIEWKRKGKIYMSCNPGKNFLYSDFFLPFERGELDNTKIFIQALPEDNEFLDDETLKLYRNTDDRIMKEIYYYGNWHFDNDPRVLFSYDNLNQIFINKLFNNDSDEMYMTVDLAGRGKDLTTVIIWKGMEIIHIYTEKQTDQAILVKLLEGFESEYGIKRANVAIDSSGLGGGFEDFYKGCFRFIGGSKSIEKKEEEIRKENGEDKEHNVIRYSNDRSACFFRLASKVSKGEIYCSIDDYKEQIINELSYIKESMNSKDTNVKQIISKDDIKKMLGHSPDFGDAISMRMVFDLTKNDNEVEVDVNSIIAAFNFM